MAWSFLGDICSTRRNGLVRVLKSTSFLMMLPTPAKIAWSSSTSAISACGKARVFFKAALGLHCPDMISAVKSYSLLASPPSIHFTDAAQIVISPFGRFITRRGGPARR